MAAVIWVDLRIWRRAPHRKVGKQVALLLRAPRAGAKNVVEHHARVDAVPLGNRLDAVGSEGAPIHVSCGAPPVLSRWMRDGSLGIDISDLAGRASLVFRELSRDAEGVAELGLFISLLKSHRNACTLVVTDSSLTLPVLNSPYTSVMLWVEMPPPSIASTALAPVEMWTTFWRRSEISVAEMKVGGFP